MLRSFISSGAPRAGLRRHGRGSVGGFRHRLALAASALAASAPRLLPLLLAATASILLPGCFSISRVETDLYSNTRRDTTIRENVINTPGDRDNGTIYPSPRTVEITRRYTQQDSIVNRYYPAFLRLGGIEAASFFAPGGSTRGAGNGLFGLYDLLTLRRTKDTKTFAANMYRIAPYETRLRWLGDEPNWTIGFSAIERFVRQRDSSSDISSNEELLSIGANVYIRKRIFFRERPPYVMLVPFFGLSAFPSQYVNLGSTLDVGSLGGFNLRAYAGYVAGTRLGALGGGDGMAFPYFGLGVSALDFVNRTDELFVEWKDYQHVALEVSGLNVNFIKSFSDGGTFGTDSATTSSAPFTGLNLRAASATIPLPFGDRRFFVGASLLNLMILSKSEIAISFLPIRAGYRMNVYKEDFFVEPFAELSYYPSSAFQIGLRGVARISDYFPLEAYLAYANGSANLDVLTGLEDLAGKAGFSTIYFGIGIGVGDVIHKPAEVHW